MGKIEKILKKGPVEGQTTEVYPVTSTKAVYDENNKRLDNIITGLQESVYLNTPIPISTDNTPESIAQNVKNIADYVEKAKAAGIADVNGIGVTCLIDDYLSGVGYIFGNTNVSIQGIKIPDDIVNNAVFTIFNGRYDERFIVGVDELDKVTSNMLVQGARKPIILTPNTTEVNEETYQKLLKDNVDVLLKDASGNVYRLTTKDEDDTTLYLYFTCITLQGTPAQDIHIFGFNATITKNSPHTCSIDANFDDSITVYLDDAGYLNKSTLFPVLKEIDLSGTDADRKAKLDQFAVDWKALTSADTLDGAKFVGCSRKPNNFFWGIFIYNSLLKGYSAIATSSNLSIYQIFILSTGAIISNSLFYHLEPVIIRTGNTDSDMANNVAAIKEYINNLNYLGVPTYHGFTIPVSLTGNEFCGYLICNKYQGDRFVLSGTVFSEGIVKSIVIDGTGRYEEMVDITGTNPLNTTSDNMVDAINEVNTLAKNKQDKLISGTNIKTINGKSVLGSGDITINSAYPKVVHGTNDTTFTLTPNAFHVWDKVTSLTLNLGSGTSDVVNEYLFQFTSGSTATSLTLPNSIKWMNDSVPTIKPKMIYQVNILNGLANVSEFSSAFNVNNYLTIEALEDNLTATFTNDVEYAIDGDEWVKLASGSETQPINVGQTLSFRGEFTPAASRGIGTFTINKKCNLKGNCMSMLFGDNAADNYSLRGKNYAFYKLFSNCKNIVNVDSNFLPATTLALSCYLSMFSNCTSLTTAPVLPATTLASSIYCYSFMFKGCTSLTTAPALPATTLASSCYSNMFQGCTKLTTAPELPATTLAEYCYGDMFNGCTSLTTAPTLPSTILANYCYQYMFSNCTSLTTAPVLPATTLKSYCYYNMFNGCTSLNYIKCLATDISASNCTNNWVSGVASTGTFVKAAGMTSWSTDTKGIPTGWTVQNA